MKQKKTVFQSLEIVTYKLCTCIIHFLFHILILTHKLKKKLLTEIIFSIILLQTGLLWYLLMACCTTGFIQNLTFNKLSRFVPTLQTINYSAVGRKIDLCDTLMLVLHKQQHFLITSGIATAKHNVANVMMCMQFHTFLQFFYVVGINLRIMYVQA